MNTAKMRTFLAATLMLTFFASATQPAWAEPPAKLRVLSYNIKIGTKNSEKLPEIADIIKRNSPDIVAIQEVDVKAARSGNVDQIAVLAKLTGMYPVFGRARDTGGGQYGVAILSKTKPKNVENHPLPGKGMEPRTALTVQIELGPGKPTIDFIATHLALPQHDKETKTRNTAVQESQAQFIVEKLVKKDSNTILAGDLNALPKSASIKMLLQHFADASASSKENTFPAKKPIRRVDYVLYRPADRWRVVESRVLDEPTASDHRPLLVVLEHVPYPL